MNLQFLPLDLQISCPSLQRHLLFIDLCLPVSSINVNPTWMFLMIWRSLWSEVAPWVFIITKVCSLIFEMTMSCLNESKLYIKLRMRRHHIVVPFDMIRSFLARLISWNRSGQSCRSTWALLWHPWMKKCSPNWPKSLLLLKVTKGFSRFLSFGIGIMWLSEVYYVVLNQIELDI